MLINFILGQQVTQMIGLPMVCQTAHIQCLYQGQSNVLNNSNPQTIRICLPEDGKASIPLNQVKSNVLYITVQLSFSLDRLLPQCTHPTKVDQCPLQSEVCVRNTVYCSKYIEQLLSVEELFSPPAEQLHVDSIFSLHPGIAYLWEA